MNYKSWSNITNSVTNNVDSEELPSSVPQHESRHLLTNRQNLDTTESIIMNEKYLTKDFAPNTSKSQIVGRYGGNYDDSDEDNGDNNGFTNKENKSNKKKTNIKNKKQQKRKSKSASSFIRRLFTCAGIVNSCTSGQTGAGQTGQKSSVNDSYTIDKKTSKSFTNLIPNDTWNDKMMIIIDSGTMSSKKNSIVLDSGKTNHAKQTWLKSSEKKTTEKRIDLPIIRVNDDDQISFDNNDNNYNTNNDNNDNYDNNNDQYAIVPHIVQIPSVTCIDYDETCGVNPTNDMVEIVVENYDDDNMMIEPGDIADLDMDECQDEDYHDDDDYHPYDYENRKRNSNPMGNNRKLSGKSMDAAVSVAHYISFDIEDSADDNQNTKLNEVITSYKLDENRLSVCSKPSSLLKKQLLSPPKITDCFSKFLTANNIKTDRGCVVNVRTGSFNLGNCQNAMSSNSLLSPNDNDDDQLKNSNEFFGENRYQQSFAMRNSSSNYSFNPPQQHHPQFMGSSLDATSASDLLVPLLLVTHGNRKNSTVATSSDTPLMATSGQQSSTIQFNSSNILKNIDKIIFNECSKKYEKSGLPTSSTDYALVTNNNTTSADSYKTNHKTNGSSSTAVNYDSSTTNLLSTNTYIPSSTSINNNLLVATLMPPQLSEQDQMRRCSHDPNIEKLHISYINNVKLNSNAPVLSSVSVSTENTNDSLPNLNQFGSKQRTQHIHPPLTNIDSSSSLQLSDERGEVFNEISKVDKWLGEQKMNRNKTPTAVVITQQQRNLTNLPSVTISEDEDNYDSLNSPNYLIKIKLKNEFDVIESKKGEEYGGEDGTTDSSCCFNDTSTLSGACSGNTEKTNKTSKYSTIGAVTSVSVAGGGGNCSAVSNATINENTSTSSNNTSQNTTTATNTTKTDSAIDIRSYSSISNSSKSSRVNWQSFTKNYRNHFFHQLNTWSKYQISAMSLEQIMALRKLALIQFSKLVEKQHSTMIKTLRLISKRIAAAEFQRAYDSIDSINASNQTNSNAKNQKQLNNSSVVCLSSKSSTIDLKNQRTSPSDPIPNDNIVIESKKVSHQLGTQMGSYPTKGVHSLSKISSWRATKALSTNKNKEFSSTHNESSIEGECSMNEFTSHGKDDEECMTCINDTDHLVNLNSIVTAKHLSNIADGKNQINFSVNVSEKPPKKIGGLAQMPTVFGVSLSSIMQYTGQPLPQPILEAMRYIRKISQQEVGLFRKNGNKARINKLKEIINKNEPIDFQSEDLTAFDVADTIKLYFRELPECLITNKLSEILLSNYTKIGPGERKIILQQLMLLVPDENRLVLQTLLLFLSDVAKNHKINQMNRFNLAVCFGPVIFCLNYDSHKKKLKSHNKNLLNYSNTNSTNSSSLATSYSNSTATISKPTSSVNETSQMNGSSNQVSTAGPSLNACSDITETDLDIKKLSFGSEKSRLFDEPCVNRLITTNRLEEALVACPLMIVSNNCSLQISQERNPSSPSKSQTNTFIGNNSNTNKSILNTNFNQSSEQLNSSSSTSSSKSNYKHKFNKAASTLVNFGTEKPFYESSKDNLENLEYLSRAVQQWVSDMIRYSMELFTVPIENFEKLKLSASYGSEPHNLDYLYDLSANKIKRVEFFTNRVDIEKTYWFYFDKYEDVSIYYFKNEYQTKLNLHTTSMNNLSDQNATGLLNSNNNINGSVVQSPIVSSTTLSSSNTNPTTAISSTFTPNNNTSPTVNSNESNDSNLQSSQINYTNNFCIPTTAHITTLNTTSSATITNTSLNNFSSLSPVSAQLANTAVVASTTAAMIVGATAGVSAKNTDNSPFTSSLFMPQKNENFNDKLKLWKCCTLIKHNNLTLDKIVNRIKNERHLWDDDFKDGQIVENLDEQTDLYRYVVHFMPPHPSRDFFEIRHISSSQSKDQNETAIITSVSVKHQLSSKLIGDIRSNMIISKYVIEKLHANDTTATFKINHYVKLDYKGFTLEFYNKTFGYMMARLLYNLKISLMENR